MLKLNTAANAAEPFWLEILPGQRTQFRRATLAMILAAREEAGRAMLVNLPAVTGGGALPSPISAGVTEAYGKVGFVLAMAKLGIVAWESVGDLAGEPIEPTPEAIAEYISHPAVYDSVLHLYVAPAIVGDAEKNGSSPSRNGPSGAGKNTARSARKRARNVHSGRAGRKPSTA
jgi:hypothetical protein